MGFLDNLKSTFTKVPKEVNKAVTVVGSAFDKVPNQFDKAVTVVGSTFDKLPSEINKIVPQVTNYFNKTIDPALASGFASFSHMMSSGLTGGPSHSGSPGDSSSGSSGGSSSGPADYMTEFTDYASTLTTVDYLCIAGGAGLLIYLVMKKKTVS